MAHPIPHSNAVSRARTPEELELERKEGDLRRLEAELADRELELATLQSDLAAFDKLYFDWVGSRFARLDELEAQIAAALAGRPGDPAPNMNHEAEPVNSTAAPTASDDLKRLYRDAARALHPDLTTNPAEQVRRTTLMAEVNAAYEKRDAKRIEELLRAWRDDPDAVPGADTAARLVRCIRKIAQVERRLATIAATIRELKASDLCRLKATVDEAKSKGRDLLREMRESVDARIRASRDRLAAVARGSHSGAQTA